MPPAMQSCALKLKRYAAARMVTRWSSHSGTRSLGDANIPSPREKPTHILSSLVYANACSENPD
jgi:hypothetical protein